MAAAVRWKLGRSRTETEADFAGADSRMEAGPAVARASWSRAPPVPGPATPLRPPQELPQSRPSAPTRPRGSQRTARTGKGSRLGAPPGSHPDDELQQGEQRGRQGGDAVADGGGPQGGLRLLHLAGITAGHHVARPRPRQEQGGQPSREPDDQGLDAVDHLRQCPGRVGSLRERRHGKEGDDQACSADHHGQAQGARQALQVESPFEQMRATIGGAADETRRAPARGPPYVGGRRRRSGHPGVPHTKHAGALCHDSRSRSDAKNFTNRRSARWRRWRITSIEHSSAKANDTRSTPSNLVAPISSASASVIAPALTDLARTKSGCPQGRAGTLAAAVSGMRRSVCSNSTIRSRRACRYAGHSSREARCSPLGSSRFRDSRKPASTSASMSAVLPGKSHANRPATRRSPGSSTPARPITHAPRSSLARRISSASAALRIELLVCPSNSRSRSSSSGIARGGRLGWISFPSTASGAGPVTSKRNAAASVSSTWGSRSICSSFRRSWNLEPQHTKPDQQEPNRNATNNANFRSTTLRWPVNPHLRARRQRLRGCHLPAPTGRHDLGGGLLVLDAPVVQEFSCRLGNHQ